MSEDESSNIRPPDEVIVDQLLPFIDDFGGEELMDPELQRVIEESKKEYQEKLYRQRYESQIERMKKEQKEKEERELNERITIKQKNIDPLITLLFKIKNSDVGALLVWERLVEFRNNNDVFLKLDQDIWGMFEGFINEYYNNPIEQNKKPKLEKNCVQYMLLYIKPKRLL